MGSKILLSHGSGGKQTNTLINDLFLKYFSNSILNEMNDAAKLTLEGNKVAFTTDSFVVKPIFFKGGNIGKLAVCGTVNDIAVSGAKPVFLSSAFIIEEGFEMSKLEEIVRTMAEEAKGSGVKIVAGDTKVVERGSVDEIFINTTGIGILRDDVNIKASNAKPGDLVLVNGNIGEHGMAIMCERNELGFEGDIKSDCVSLNGLIDLMLKVCPDIHVLRDATRGGLAAVLNEIAQSSNVSIKLMEKSIPVRDEISGLCELLGLDPIYIANEGKLCAFIPKEYAADVLDAMRKHPLGINSTIVGEVMADSNNKVYISTIVGGQRIVDMPSGQQLPRIC